jgi:hypothetical protein
MVPAINAQVPQLYANRQLETQQRQWDEQQRQWQSEQQQANSQFQQNYDLNKSIADRNYQMAQAQALQQKKDAKTAMLVQGLQGAGSLYSAYKMGEGLTAGVKPAMDYAGQDAVETSKNLVAGTTPNAPTSGWADGGSSGSGMLGTAWNAAKDFGGDVLSSYGDMGTWGYGAGGAVIGGLLGDSDTEQMLYGAAAGAGLNLAGQAISGELFSSGVDFASTVGSGLLGLAGGLFG